MNNINEFLEQENNYLKEHFGDKQMLFVKKNQRNLINFVLGLVQTEVEKQRVTPEHKGSYEVTVCGITNEMCDRFSTIITNLKLK